MITEEQKTLLKGHFVAIATVNNDGSPNLMVAEINDIPDEVTLVFTDNFMNRSKDNILRDGRICLTTWDEKGGFKVYGKARYFTEGPWMEFLKPLNKDLPCKGAVVMTVESVISLG